MPETSVRCCRSQWAIKHTIISVQSEVVRGYVGNSAARFALQRLGCEVWAVPTVVLSNHPGHGAARGEAFSPSAMLALFDGLLHHGWTQNCSAIISGYLSTPEQASAVAAMVNRLKSTNPKAIYVCDPVFGDDDGAYAKLGVAEAIARDLVPLADVLTPNRFELSSLTSQRIDSPADAVRAARLLGAQEVLVTSVPCPEGIGNVAVDTNGAWMCAVGKLDGVPHGTGDLLTALYARARVLGLSTPKATADAVTRLQGVIAASQHCDELSLIAAQDLLASPLQMLAVQPLA